MIAGIQSTHRAQLLCFCCFHLVCLLCRCVTFFRVFLECDFSFMAASVGRFLFSFVTGFNLEKVWRISVSARMQTKPVTEKCRHGMDIFSFLHLCIHIYACIYIWCRSLFPPWSTDRWMQAEQKHLWSWRMWEQPDRAHLSLPSWLPFQPAEEHLWG